ncbi:MAG: ROK family protein, partial [Planctomycetes bacterium]|nr:ROK family protein [Planctomycetota bacterium]
MSYNANRGFLVGVDVGRTRIRAMAADLLGEVLWEDSRPFSPTKGGDRTQNAILDAIAAAVDFVPSDNGRAVCVGIGRPGIIRDNALRLAPEVAGCR